MRYRCRMILGLALSAAPSFPLPAQRAADGATTETVGAVRDYLRRAEAFGFAGAVLVARHDSAIVLDGYGFADLARGRRVTTRTPFFIASLSKQFVAAAILALAEQEQLALDDPVSTFFPELPATQAAMSIHQLLSHTAGVVGNLPDSVAGDTRDAYVRAVLAAPGNVAPGSRYAYSNAGYGVLAAIIERVTREPFAQAMRRLVFAPAGMTDSYTADAPRAGPGVTIVRRGTLEQGTERVAHRTANWSRIAGIGVITTIADLRRWEQALGTDRVIGDASRRRMWTEVRDGYGYGWAIGRTIRGTRIVSHDGLLMPEGWNAQYRRYVDEGTTVVVLSNTFAEDGLSGVIARGIERVLFGGGVTVPPRAQAVATPPSALRLFAGRYVDSTGVAFRVWRDSAGWKVRPEGQRAVSIFLTRSHTPQPEAERANARAARVFRTLLAMPGETVAGDSALAAEYERRASRFAETRDGLRAMFGAPDGFEVLHTTSSPSDPLRATYVRLRFPEDSAVLRLIWDGDRLIGMTDLGSFIDPSRTAELSPDAVAAIPQGGGVWAAHHLVTGATIHWRLERSPGGDGGDMVLLLREGTLRLRRAP